MDDEKTPREEDIQNELREYGDGCLMTAGMISVMMAIVLGVGLIMTLSNVLSALLIAK